MYFWTYKNFEKFFHLGVKCVKHIENVLALSDICVYVNINLSFLLSFVLSCDQVHQWMNCCVCI